MDAFFNHISLATNDINNKKTAIEFTVAFIAKINTLSPDEKDSMFNLTFLPAEGFVCVPGIISKLASDLEALNKDESVPGVCVIPFP